MKTTMTWALCGLLLASSSTVALAQTYTITDLGVLSGDSSSLGDWINDFGHVVGCSDPNPNSFPCSENSDGQHAAVWTTRFGLRDLGALPGGNISQPYAINNSDEIVGYSFTNEGTSHAFRWFLKTGMQDLGTLPGGTFSIAVALNSHGEIVGESDYEGSGGQPDAVLWDTHGKIHDLGKLSGAQNSSSAAVNKSLHVAGTANFGGGVFHGFFWNLANGMRDLGTLSGGTESFVGFINDSGLIVGGSDSANSPGILQCVVWDQTFKIHQVAQFPGGCGFFDMNDNGQAVGGGTDASGVQFALFWSVETGAEDLNTEIPPDSGWILADADSINLSGEITGWGTINGSTHGFLLTPKQ